LLLRHSFLCLLIILFALPPLPADTVRTIPLEPGTPTEAAHLLSGLKTNVEAGERRADAGGRWTYRIVLPPLARCILMFTVDGEPTVAAAGSDGKPLPSRTERSGSVVTVYTTAPANHPPGAGIRITVSAKDLSIAVRDVRASIRMPDRNNDGVTDFVEAAMGLPPGRSAAVTPKPDRPRTSFQEGGPYRPEIAAPTDAVLAYTQNPDIIAGWADKGYTVQTMGGFRATETYMKEHPGEVQKDVNGSPITIGGNSYYMIPTLARIELAKQFYTMALGAGSTAICPEEPEIWARAGYSDAFKAEWQARYGTPWLAPHSSIDARYKAEQLKAYLTRRQIESILDEAQKVKPSATRMLAVHSPVTYYDWAITLPHYSLLMIPSLQEIIGQVWTGTARTAARSAGVRAERTFEVGFLEYSSLFNLTRGTGKRMWFLMDPVEDNPDLPMEDYQRNYERTLAAALMFPAIDSYEVMPWPGRIYDRVPSGYATIVNTVVGTLAEMWRYPNGQVVAGSPGIGTFIADSMGWQREEPYRSDYDGFYALTLPLVQHGVPVDVLSLDRAHEVGYLNRNRTLLLSYDYLKPAGPEANRALADWTRRGGTLILFGGTDAYNDLQDAWWKKAGYAAPYDDLFIQLGLRATRMARPPAILTPVDLKTVLTSDGGSTRRRYTIDLTPFTRRNGNAAVRFEDITPQDGLGPALAAAELRIDGKLAAAFRTGSELETRFLADEEASRFNGETRFADRTGYWVYRFDNLPKDKAVSLTLDIGSGFLVKAGPAPERAPLLETADASFDRTVAKLRLTNGYPLTVYAPPPGATALYSIAGDPTPTVWETRVGLGKVMYVGVAPGYLSATAQASRWLRALTRRAYESFTGNKYQEQSYFVSKRGPYTAVRALGKEYTAEGRHVNLLSPTLAVVEDPIVQPHDCALFQDVGAEMGAPRLLAASGRLRAKAETSDETGFFVQAPSKTEGIARLWTGRRKIKGVKAFTTLGIPLEARCYPDGDTVLIRYANDADGVVVRIGWD
jgi:hypothetical protein